jgi:hypothetical protein
MRIIRLPWFFGGHEYCRKKGVFVERIGMLVLRGEHVEATDAIEKCLDSPIEQNIGHGYLAAPMEIIKNKKLTPSNLELEFPQVQVRWRYKIQSWSRLNKRLVMGYLAVPSPIPKQLQPPHSNQNTSITEQNEKPRPKNWRSPWILESIFKIKQPTSCSCSNNEAT